MGFNSAFKGLIAFLHYKIFNLSFYTLNGRLEKYGYLLCVVYYGEFTAIFVFLHTKW